MWKVGGQSGVIVYKLVVCHFYQFVLLAVTITHSLFTTNLTKKHVIFITVVISKLKYVDGFYMKRVLYNAEKNT